MVLIFQYQQLSKQPAWKGIVKSATEVEEGFPCLTFSGGKKSFDAPQFQLR